MHPGGVDEAHSPQVDDDALSPVADGAIDCTVELLCGDDVKLAAHAYDESEAIASEENEKRR